MRKNNFGLIILSLIFPQNGRFFCEKFLIVRSVLFHAHDFIGDQGHKHVRGVLCPIKDRYDFQFCFHQWQYLLSKAPASFPQQLWASKSAPPSFAAAIMYGPGKPSAQRPSRMVFSFIQLRLVVWFKMTHTTMCNGSSVTGGGADKICPHHYR